MADSDRICILLETSLCLRRNKSRVQNQILVLFDFKVELESRNVLRTSVELGGWTYILI